MITIILTFKLITKQFRQYNKYKSKGSETIKRLFATDTETQLPGRYGTCQKRYTYNISNIFVREKWVLYFTY